MIEFFIAKKHMLERKKQSFISIVGILIGVVVLTVSIGISNGLDKNMISSVLSISSHILIQPGEAVTNYKVVSEEIKKVDGVKGVVENVPTQGIYKHSTELGSYVSGIKIQGFNMESAVNSLNLDKKIKEGKISSELNSILIGTELATNSDSKIGDEITLISSENKEIKFIVSGIFQTGYYDYDSNVVMINIAAAQYMTNIGDAVKEFNIILDDPYLADKVNRELFEKHGIIGRTWGELNKNLLSALSLEKSVMIILFSLLIVIAGFVVWVTLNMLVREKIKDIGILRAMGFSKKNISLIFLIQGLILGGLGIIFGILIALFILWYIKNFSLPGISSIYYIQKIPIEISIREIGVIVLSNLLIIFISSVFPAYRASKLETQEALKYE